MEFICQGDGSKQKPAKRQRKEKLSDRMDNVEGIVASLMVDFTKFSKFTANHKDNDEAFKSDIRRKLQLMWDCCTKMEHRLDKFVGDKDKIGNTSSGIGSDLDPVDFVFSDCRSAKHLFIRESKSTPGRTPADMKLQGPQSFTAPSLRKAKGKGKKVLSDNLGALSRRLFPDESVEGESTHSLIKPLKQEESGVDASPKNDDKVSLPDGLEVVFYPTKSMFLTDLEVQVAAYIYSAKKSIEEILVECAGGILPRKELQSLTPNRWVYGGVLTMVASKMTHEERKKSVIRYWYFPPTLSEGTIDKNLTPDLAMKDYGLLFMSNSVNHIEKIYIPINAENVHWFLLVISLKEEKLFYLDSAPTPATEDDRHGKILQMATFMENLLKDCRLHNTRWVTAPQISKWPIIVPPGVPRQTEFYDCGVWVAGWMILDAIWGDYETVPWGAYGRLRLALDLVLGDFNKKKDQVVLAAKDFWMKHQNIIYL